MGVRRGEEILEMADICVVVGRKVGGYRCDLGDNVRKTFSDEISKIEQESS